MRLFAYILLVFFIASCQDIPPVEKPGNLIDKEKMEEIIYENAIVNGARGYNMQLLSKYGVHPETYIFDKFGIDSLQYANSVAYYSSDIEGYKKMYQSIQERVDGEFFYYDSIAKKEKKIKDSLRTIKAKEIKREKDSIRQLDSVKGVGKKKNNTPFRISKEIVIDSL